MSDEPCFRCGATPLVFHFDCPECVLRREDAECRELSERLFTVAVPELPE